jgi:hypothetical protein
MNNKQKLGYMILGAGIMGIGIIIGQFITPDIEAQSNGVFDEIQCSRLSVVNGRGESRVEIGPSNITVYDQENKEAIVLRITPVFGNQIVIYKEGKFGCWLEASEIGNSMKLFNQDGSWGVNLLATDFANGVAVLDKDGEQVLGLVSDKDGDRIIVHDKAGNMRWEAP